VGDLVSAKGIAEGVSNSNWLVETTQARFILTMYERRIELDDLPYFLGLLDHLAVRNCPVPRTIHDHEGAAFRMVEGKAVALIEFLPGVSPTQPTCAQTAAVGKALAQMHLASQDFGLSRANTMGFDNNLATLRGCGEAGLASIHPDLPAMIGPAEAAARLDLSGLPVSNIHADLFPDNVLMLGPRVSGMIDFYFACHDTMALDLATTHAAWCFNSNGSQCNNALSDALIEGYESIRPLEKKERTLLPEIAKGAALRFVASRAEDWLDTPDDALVTRKDPAPFVSRWRVYDNHGADMFA